MQITKRRFIPRYVDVTEESNADFDALLSTVNTNHIKQGTVIKGQVIKIDGNLGRKMVVIDVGLGSDGRIPAEEFESTDTQALPKIGDIVEVYVSKVEGRNGRTVLSRRQAVIEKLWDKLVEIWEKGEHIQGIILERVKGGFVVKLGELGEITAFLPGSQIDVRPVKDISSIMNIVQPFKIVKMSKQDTNIVVSRKAVLEESRSEARNEMLANIKEGMILEGIVKNITQYGAFIDLGSLDGLLHVTDISWSRINHPSEILVVGQKLKVIVTKFNEENKRISLGLKQLQANPWDDIKEEFPVGKKVIGKVTNFFEFGALVELKEGIEGRVNFNEISWIKSNQNPKKALTIGQEIECVVLEVDTQKPKIALSIKQCQENPYINFAQNHPEGMVVRGVIKNITDFGLTVELDSGLEGLIHESEMVEKGEDKLQILQNYKKGEEIECIILSVEVEKEKIKLGIDAAKKFTSEPSVLNEFKKNTTHSCTITSIHHDILEVEVFAPSGEKALGIIKKSDLSSDKSEQRMENFNEGDTIEAKIITLDKKANKIHFSIKALEQEAKEKALKDYGSTDSRSSLGDILGAAIKQEENKK